MDSRHGKTHRSTDDIDAVIRRLGAACADREVNVLLERLLSLPAARRRALVQEWLSDLLSKGAPKDFTDAIACLLDDAIADRAYATIFQGGR